MHQNGNRHARGLLFLVALAAATSSLTQSVLAQEYFDVGIEPMVKSGSKTISDQIPDVVKEVGINQPVEFVCNYWFFFEPSKAPQFQANQGMAVVAPWQGVLRLNGVVVGVFDGPTQLPTEEVMSGNPWNWYHYYRASGTFSANAVVTQEGANYLGCELPTDSASLGFAVVPPLQMGQQTPQVEGAPQAPILPPEGPVVRRDTPARAQPPTATLTPPPGRTPGPAAARPMTPGGRPTAFNFAPPIWNGSRVDLCLVWGSQCGIPAATEFCKKSGYNTAIAWQPANDIGAQSPTLVLGENKICSEASCDGFASITCSM